MGCDAVKGQECSYCFHSIYKEAEDRNDTKIDTKICYYSQSV